MILLTMDWPISDPTRRAEITECLRRNLPLFERVVVFLEGNAQPTPDPKLTVVSGPRPTFHDLFRYANEKLPGRRIMVANADIHFDETVQLLDVASLAGKFLAISRMEGEVLKPDAHGSQDCWAFLSPIPDFPCDFSFGALGCDNRITRLAADAGLQVLNPCLSVRAHHLHSSPQRSYGPTVPGPYMHVPPVAL